MLTLSCKKAYKPHLASVSTNFLAVDGPIISGDSTFIRLSRTTSLTDTTQNKAELKATVAIESDQNTLYPLIENGKGLYVLGAINFNTARKYRLDIKTNDGKIYQSDFVPMKITPPIDSTYFEVKDNNHILFYLSTHDVTNNTRYYRWDYKETWAHVALYRYLYYYNNGTVSSVRPGLDPDISRCYRTTTSNEILIGSSSRLENDVIARQQLGGINNSEKIAHGYVLQIRQYALTKEGFEYYQALKANTEQIGTIFDAQPSALKGNIHCISNPAENVIGFISVSTTTTKQSNLTYSQIPINLTDSFGTINWYKENLPSYHVYNAYTFGVPDTSDCHYERIFGDPVQNFKLRADATLGKGDKVVFDMDYDPTGKPIYIYAPKQCVDCRVQGGSIIRPSYFPFSHQ